jgi:septal ring-binding cell division protein DamX
MYTVQLALACEDSTVARAAGSTRGSSQFFILPTTFRDQACYRLLWGAYSSKAAAVAGKKGIPQAFLKDPHPPVVSAL